MAKLKDIIAELDAAALHGDAGAEVASLTLDSRAAGPGSLFFAVRGTQADGHDYIESAVGGGAAAVVCERLPENPAKNVTYVVVEDCAKAVGPAASAFYGHPSRALKLVGVTGTNGKTTTATLLCDLFRALGYGCGLISTVEYRVGGRTEPATHTTPDAIRLNAMLAGMVDEGCEYCFMEVSSHSVVQWRIRGLEFAGGVFTNITHDHLDYHETFAEYIRAKKLFFDTLPPEAFALVNADDRNGRVMVQNTRAAASTYALRSMADYRFRIVEMHFDGMLLAIDEVEVWVKFTGRFNAYNLLSVYAAARLLDADKDETLRELSLLTPVRGRFETLRSADGVTAIVDYAHTPDALANVIETINEIRTPEQRLCVVAGCGGNRDASKRPVMARIASEGGDTAILTSDNPRHEDPAEIIEQMKKGLDPTSRCLAITDRREAIRTAVMTARPGDIVLVAGKGHETYQDVKGVKHRFDDREEIEKAFAELR